MPDPTRDDLIRKLAANPRLAHQVLFRHRHPDETPAFHGEMVDLWYSPHPQVLTMAFRGGAKSTVAEEAITTMACLRTFRNGIILGENEPRAIERLTAIKHEFESNEFLIDLFGPLVGNIWQEKKIVLSNGVVLQAFGRGQSLRGAKHLSARPDLAFGDDMEDDECVATPEAREKFKQWFLKVVIPALSPGYRFRIAGTPLDPESWLMKLAAAADWKTRVFPIEHKDMETGERKATWESRFPLEAIDSKRKSYYDLGAAQEYQQEYMCEASDPASRTFTSDMIRVEPTIRTWHPVYAMFDPARTADKNKSATTGWAAWSWVGSQMTVWESGGGYWKPDEIVNKIFEVNDTFRPITLGVEQTGLHEFIMQPLRAEQVRRGQLIPIEALNAPMIGQIGVIKGLQPFFKAGDVTFAKSMPDLEKQMLAFPTGHRDTLNALAYAPRLRPGLPVYDGFRAEHVSETVELRPREAIYLAVGATGQYTTAVLCQFIQGVLNVTHDWCCEGDPGASLGDVVQSASLAARRTLRVVCGPAHFDPHDTVGLRAAARKVPVQMDRGGAHTVGRESLRALLGSAKRGHPAVNVHSDARWTVNALAGGYCRAVTKAGVVTDFPVDGPYRTLMESLESLVALTRVGLSDGDSPPNFAYSPSGHKYLTSLPQPNSQGLQATKR
jgi:hypothetical protein